MARRHIEDVRAVIFDWAGTIVDFGSFAPMGAFVETFSEFGVTVSFNEARAPMGLPKRDHIRAMLASDTVAAAWVKTFGAPANEADVDRIYDVFVPLNEAVAAKYADLVPGFLNTVDYLRDRNIRIGSTTGYTRSIMDHVIPVAEAQGFVPDCVICSDELVEGRPGPLGIYKCMVELGVYPPDAVIKVDDTVPGILEGVSAGCPTIGVTLSGNAVGMTHDAVHALSENDRRAHHEAAASVLAEAGADHVIETVADLPKLLEAWR